MRFRALPVFHRYYRSGCTCGFCSFSLSACTHARTVHAFSALRLFPQVLLLGLYMRFPHLLAFRTYSCSICTCGFGSLPLSAGTLARGLRAVSALRRSAAHVLFSFQHSTLKFYIAYMYNLCYSGFVVNKNTANRFTLESLPSGSAEGVQQLLQLPISQAKGQSTEKCMFPFSSEEINLLHSRSKRQNEREYVRYYQQLLSQSG